MGRCEPSIVQVSITIDKTVTVEHSSHRKMQRFNPATLERAAVAHIQHPVRRCRILVT